MLSNFSVVLYKDQFLLFGGENQDKLWTNQLRVLDKSFKVTQTTEFSVKRDGHSANVVNDKMYIFGGSSKKGSFTTCFNLSEKQEIQLNEENSPVERKDHTTIEYNKKIYLFGGKSLDKEPKFLNDLYEFDPETSKWKEILSNAPCERSGHAAVINEGQMIIFGGYNIKEKEVSYFKDFYSFNFETMKWTKLEIKGDAILPREGHDMVVKEKNVLLIAGGWIPNFQGTDLYQIDLEQSTASLLPFKTEKNRNKFKMVWFNDQLYFIGGIGYKLEEIYPVNLDWFIRKRDPLETTKKPKQLKKAPSKKKLTDNDFQGSNDHIDILSKDFDKLEQSSKVIVEEKPEEVKKSFVPPKGGVSMVNPFGGFVPKKK